MTHTFDEVIQDRARLREIMGEPSHRVTGKVINHVDDICRQFIACATYVVIATQGRDGLPDVSPRGDPAGFVAVLDNKTLAIPDRLGNKRIDSFENLLSHPEIGLLFLIPGHSYTLRISGAARIVKDATLQKQLAVSGQEPLLVVVVTVAEAFMHCAKSFARSGLWRPQTWPDATQVPSLAEAMVAHGRLAESQAEMQAIIDKDFGTRMY